jgi:hypothetical protein
MVTKPHSIMLPGRDPQEREGQQDYTSHEQAVEAQDQDAEPPQADEQQVGQSAEDDELMLNLDIVGRSIVRSHRLAAGQARRSANQISGINANEDNFNADAPPLGRRRMQMPDGLAERLRETLRQSREQRGGGFRAHISERIDPRPDNNGEERTERRQREMFAAGLVQLHNPSHETQNDAAGSNPQDGIGVDPAHDPDNPAAEEQARQRVNMHQILDRALDIIGNRER